PPGARRHEGLATCPEARLLFMHHVPYTHVLHSGKTVLQHFYDAHYQGAAEAARFVQEWEALEGRVDEQRYRETLTRLRYQAGHAVVWRDAVNDWFLQKSGIPDKKGRVGQHPNRIEAEAMRLEGYAVTNSSPFEAASRGRAVQVIGPHRRGSVSFAYHGPAGRRDLVIQYFDEDDGVSQFDLFVAGHWVDQWKADQTLPTPTNLPNAHSSTRHTLRDLALR